MTIRLRRPFLVFFCCPIAFLVGVKAVSDNIACGSKVQTNVCLPRNYSSMDIPLIDEPNKILIEIHISDILEINDRDFSITFSLYFNVQWKEPRLHLNPSFFQNSSMDPDQLNPVDLNLVHDIWLPNVFIYNLKTFKVIDVLSRLAGLWVNAKKQIMYSQASQITIICPMIFNYFPLDTQVCKFQVGSYSYNMEKMIFEVTHLGYSHTSRAIVLDYDIQVQKLQEEDRMFDSGPLGNYSLAGFEMVLDRHVSHYIINYYLPSGLFVAVSWISFLVPSDIIPGRMALLVTLFLVLVNIFNTVTTNTPKAEGLTAIEAWMLACILFVFGTLTEYAFLLFKHDWGSEESEDHTKDLHSSSIRLHYARSVHRPSMDHPMEGSEIQPMTPLMATHIASTMANSNNTKGQTPITTSVINGQKHKSKWRRQRFAKIDRFFLVMFPLMFLTFNLVYWMAYYYGQKQLKMQQISTDNSTPDATVVD